MRGRAETRKDHSHGRRTDPYTNDDGGARLGANHSNVDTRTGPANRDVGHGAGISVGTIAGLGTMCKDSVKARTIESPTIACHARNALSCARHDGDAVAAYARRAMR